MKMVKGVKNQFKFANREYSETADMGKIGGHKPSKQIPTSFMDGPLKPKNCKGAFNIYVDKMRGGRGSKNVCFCPRLWYKNCPLSLFSKIRCSLTYLKI